jgi:hypothetical protein
MADQDTKGAAGSGSVWDDIANSYSRMRDLTRDQYSLDTAEGQAKYQKDVANGPIPTMDTAAGELGAMGGTLVGDLQGMWDYMTH